MSRKRELKNQQERVVKEGKWRQRDTYTEQHFLGKDETRLNEDERLEGVVDRCM